MIARVTPGSSRAWAVLALIATTALWGASYPLIKQLIDTYPPCTLAALRLVIALAVFLPLLAIQGRRPAFGWSTILLGLSGVAAYQVLQNLGMQRVSAGESVIVIYGASAVLMVILGRCMLGERCSWTTGLAMLASAAGVALVALRPSGGDSLRAPMSGLLLLLLSALAWALYAVLGRRVSGSDASETASGAVIVGLVAMLPFAAREHPNIGQLAGNRSDLVALGILGGLITVGTYILWCYSIRHLRASEASVLVSIEPVFGLFFAWMLLSEQISIRELAGVGVIVASCVVVALAASAPTSGTPRQQVELRWLD